MTERVVYTVRVPPEPESSADISVWVVAIYNVLTEKQQVAVRKLVREHQKKWA